MKQITKILDRTILTRWSSAVTCTLLASVLALPDCVEASRPNIVWIVVDDMSPNFSCYGEEAITTPNVDALAQQGLLFRRAYATSPVCSTFRSSLITGMYQTSIGAHHHRSGRGKHRIDLPSGMEPVPLLFQKAGYYTCMGSGLQNLDFRSQSMPGSRRTALGKSDYNFTWDPSIFDGNDWSGRKEKQPFFMQVQLHGGKLRGASEASYLKFEQQVLDTLGSSTSPASVKLPPYYPDDPVIRRDWANYLDSVRITDWHVGLVMERLEQEGLRDNTLVMFFTDHGISHARGKQFLYDEGTHIPLILSGPGISQGTFRDDLIEHIDIAALSLAAAGVAVPGYMQGRDVLDSNHRHKQFVYAARDRCGEADDRIRSVRSGQFLYIRNFYPSRPHLMPSNYKDSKLIIQRMRKLHATQRLGPLAERLLFAPHRPSEELYQYHRDPFQINNLASDPTFVETLVAHREALDRWIEKTGDMGSESDAVYDMEIEDQMRSTRNAASREQYRSNSEVYKAWRSKGQ